MKQSRNQKTGSTMFMAAVSSGALLPECSTSGKTYVWVGVRIVSLPCLMFRKSLINEDVRVPSDNQVGRYSPDNDGFCETSYGYCPRALHGL